MNLLDRVVDSRVRLWGVGLAAGALFLLTAYLGVQTRPGQSLDAAVYSTILNGAPGGLRWVLGQLARTVAPAAVSVAALVLAFRAARRRRWPELLVLLAPLACAGLSPWLRGAVIHRPDLGVDNFGGNSYPSTHAAVVFALLGVCWVLAPVPRRWWVRTLLVAAIIVGLGNVTWYAHRPVDVVGGFWLAVGTLSLVYAARPPRLRRPISS